MRFAILLTTAYSLNVGLLCGQTLSSLLENPAVFGTNWYKLVIYWLPSQHVLINQPELLELKCGLFGSWSKMIYQLSDQLNAKYFVPKHSNQFIN